MNKNIPNSEVAISPEQWWFWTDEWQSGELEVDEYIEAGNVQYFDSMEEFLRTLRELGVE